MLADYISKYCQDCINKGTGGRTSSAEGCLLARPVDIISFVPSCRWAARLSANAQATAPRRVVLIHGLSTNAAASTRECLVLALRHRLVSCDGGETKYTGTIPEAESGATYQVNRK